MCERMEMGIEDRDPRFCQDLLLGSWFGKKKESILTKTSGRDGLNELLIWVWERMKMGGFILFYLRVQGAWLNGQDFISCDGGFSSRIQRPWSLP